MGALVPEGSPTVGGVGTSIAKQQVNDGISDITYTSNGSWSIPAAAEDEISRTIYLEVSGGGGGAGNANAGSNCFLHFLIGLLQSQVRLKLLEDMVVEVRE